MIDGGREMLYGAKAERAMTDEFDLVIHALERALGDSQPGPGEHAREMGAQLTHQFFEGSERRAHRRVHPALEMLFGTGRLGSATPEVRYSETAHSSREERSAFPARLQFPVFPSVS